MKKMFVLVSLLVAAVCALSIINCAYDTTPEVVVLSEQANTIDTSSADLYTYERQENPVGINAENQYDILADNHLYGHCDYGDYVPAKTRYVDGFPTVDGEKTFSRYYEQKGYVKPAETDKPREDWNLHDFHANGEMFETIGNGEMIFRNDEDREAYIAALKEEFGADNVREAQLDANGNVIDSGNGKIDYINEDID